MSKEEIDLTDSSLRIASGKSLTIGCILYSNSAESEEKRERSVKSVKSPVTILSGVAGRSSSGMFNFDEGQGLATMEKKKEKLEQLCIVMNNRKQQIAEKEQLFGFEIGKKDDLISRIKILEEHKIAQNIVDTSIAPEIKQIEKIIENNRLTQIQLGQYGILLFRSIESISTDLKSRKTQEQEEVGILIKQTSQVNNDIISMEKQVEAAKKKVSQQSLESTKPSPLVAELEEAISKLTLETNEGEGNLQLVQAKHDQDKKDSELNVETLKNQLQTSQKTKSDLEERIQNLERQKGEQTAHLQKAESELVHQYEEKLKDVRESTSKLVIPENPIETVPVTPQQEEQLANLVKELEQKSAGINREEIETKLKDIEVEHQKIIQINSTVKEDQHDTESKAQEVHNLTQQISKLEGELKSLSDETTKAAKKKEQAANFLISEQNKHETALKDSEHHKLQTKIDQLKRKLHEQKIEYLKLEAFNKEFVTASIIEEYKNKNQEIREEVRELEALKSERDLLTKELEELKEEKETIEWQENAIAIGLETSIKHLKTKLQEIAKDNKDLHKKLTQSQSKVKQYKDHYPEFEIKTEKKVTKKKGGKVEEVVQPVKEVKEVKVIKDTKETKKSNKKKDKKQETKPEESEQVSENLVEQKVQQVKQQVVVEQKAKVVSSAPKSKKQKKKTTQANDEIALMNNILNSEQQDPLLSKDVKNKKEKKDKKNKNGKKQKQSSSKSKMQQQLQFLMQSTKDEAPSGFNFKSTPIFAGLFVLLTGSAYWLLS